MVLGAPPNGSRLSCGALTKKGVIQYPTRAVSFKRLLGSPRQRHSQTRLLHRDQIKLAERLLIKQRPFLAISAAPVFVTTRNSDEIARADAFGTGIIPVQIGATQNDKQHVRRMRVHPCIVSRTKLRKPPERSLGRIAPGHVAPDPRD